MLTYVKENNLQLGRERVLIMLGFGLTPIIAGSLIDFNKQQTGKTKFVLIISENIFVAYERKSPHGFSKHYPVSVYGFSDYVSIRLVR